MLYIQPEWAIGICMMDLVLGYLCFSYMQAFVWQKEPKRFDEYLHNFAAQINKTIPATADFSFHSERPAGSCALLKAGTGTERGVNPSALWSE